MEPIAITNLFARIPDRLSEEWFQTLAVGGHYKIERIVSRGHRSPSGFWYDQAWDEWVLLLQGQATLQFQPAVSEVNLAVGDSLLIPAGMKHRVDWTDPDTRYHLVGGSYHPAGGFVHRHRSLSKHGKELLVRTSEIVLTVAGIIVVLAGMKAAAVILVPFLLSAFIAIISAPAMFWLQRKGVPTLLAMLLVIVVIFGVGGLIVGLVGQSVTDFSQNLPMFQEKIKQQFTVGLGWLAERGVDTKSLALAEMFDPGEAMKLAGTMLNSVGNVLANGFLILMTVIFMLFEASGPADQNAGDIGGRRRSR